MSYFSKLLDEHKTRMTADEEAIGCLFCGLYALMLGSGTPKGAAFLEDRALDWFHAKNFAGRPMPAKGD